jgi:hypothetical protein
MICCNGKDGFRTRAELTRSGRTRSDTVDSVISVAIREERSDTTVMKMKRDMARQVIGPRSRPNGLFFAFVVCSPSPASFRRVSPFQTTINRLSQCLSARIDQPPTSAPVHSISRQLHLHTQAQPVHLCLYSIHHNTLHLTLTSTPERPEVDQRREKRTKKNEEKK